MGDETNCREYSEGKAIDELSDERKDELEERASVSTPGDVLEGLEAYRDAPGDEVHFVFRPYTPGIDTEELIEWIERVGEEVAPRL